MKQLNKMQEFRDMFIVRTACPVGSTYKQHLLNFSGHIHLGISISSTSFKHRQVSTARNSEKGLSIEKFFDCLML